MRGSVLGPLAVAALLVSACFGEDEADQTLAVTQTATREPQLSATFTIPATNTPEPSGEPLKVFWLLDAESGEVVTLLEDYKAADYWGGFDLAGERAYVWSSRPGGEEVGFDLSGNEVSRGPAPEVGPLCQPNQTVIVQGQSVPRCEDRAGWAPFPSPGAPRQYYIFDTPSPDGRWDVYEHDTGLPTQTPGSGNSYDLWAVNLQTGERWLIFRSLYRCGGCDGDEETGWSPSGRYYVHVERGPDRHVLLIDFTGRTVTDITWRNGLGFTGTVWSPVADVLLRTAGPDGLAVADLAAGTEHIVPGLEWEADFDTTGEYVYARGRSEGRDTLTVVAVATGQVVTVFDGERANSDTKPVVATPQGIVAVLAWRGADACQGISVRRQAAELGCVERAEWAAISPDGSKIALTRVMAGRDARNPDFRSPGRTPEYEIVLFDVAAGTQTVVAEGAKGFNAPRLTWNATSTHLLIEWPAHRGL